MHASVQHAHMRIACPHCQAVYDVASVEPDVGFLCSRCQREFRVDAPADDGQAHRQVPATDAQPGLFDARRPTPGQAEADGSSPAHGESPPRFLEQLAHEDAAAGMAEEPIVPQAFRPEQRAEAEMPAPERRSPRLLAWMSSVVLIIAIAGFSYNYRAWSDNLWLRSMLLNLHIPAPVHASDWRIPTDSVHAEWLKRDDGSSVLVIAGRVENRLHADLATPYIQVTVYDALHTDQIVKRETLPITQPPVIAAIRHAPWVAPPQDDVPVAAAGSRGFMLVMDGLPAHAGAFTLSVVPSLFR
jgi:hypothetical protein